ncbi:hypothetical protein M9979_02770 [Sphingomonas sp. RP10(2022)]|uniref:Uncharacterized protein n=2 Tax=Sphingomonas liriopis TaxID=2949094 RepID=A0A9X2HUM3_9SPHN|nr:hypothetical protein [Sphingomonas liriopis]
MNPSLFQCAILSLPLFILSYFSDEPYKFYFFIVACVPALISCVAFLYFMFSKVEVLQSEEFRLRDHALRIYGDSESSGAELGQIIDGKALITSAQVAHQIGDRSNG